jgi:hypothetical protein
LDPPKKSGKVVNALNADLVCARMDVGGVVMARQVYEVGNRRLGE